VILNKRVDGYHFVVVDDESISLSVTSYLLESMGAQVSDFSCPFQALDYCKKWHRDVDIVITDIVMPSMSGIALASQLSLLSPALSLIALSGNELIADQRALKEAGFLGMLAKPLSPQHLVSLITTAD